MRFRFHLRTLFLGTFVAAVLLGIVVSWWTRPYALTGSYANGQRAWEQWERRTLTLGIQHVETTRWYPDGTLAFKSRGSPTGTESYYAPNGDRIDDPRTWAATYGELITDTNEDVGSVRTNDLYGGGMDGENSVAN